MTWTGSLVALVAASSVFGQCPVGDELVVQCPDQVNSILSTGPQRAAENFVLSDDTTIQEATWWGGSAFDQATMDFSLTIFADDAGIPGTELFTWNVGSITGTPTGDSFFSFETGVMQAEYRFNSELSPPMALSANTTYWLLVAEPVSVEFYLWESGTGGDGIAKVDSGGGAFDAGVNFDLAFALYGPPSPCPWDLNGSGSVDTPDLLQLLGEWGGSGSADFDGSGTVNTPDLLKLLGAWGQCP